MPEGENQLLFDIGEHFFVTVFLLEWCMRVTAFGWVWIFEFSNAADTVMAPISIRLRGWVSYVFMSMRSNSISGYTRLIYNYIILYMIIDSNKLYSLIALEVFIFGVVPKWILAPAEHQRHLHPRLHGATGVAPGAPGARRAHETQLQGAVAMSIEERRWF